MNCVILQPSYIPWRGYFHQIYKADLFVFYDDVQFDKRSWRNRNRIKTTQGSQWLTIPVYSKGAQTENIPIHQIRICWDAPWNREHWTAIKLAYHKAPHFRTYAPLLESFYQQHPALLADFTIDMTIALAKALGIHHTQFIRSSELKNIQGARTERLVEILKAVGADHYISGPAARDYIDDEQFEKAGISLEYMRYDYEPYPQLHPPYDPQVSIIDLMFMLGEDAIQYITKETHGK